MCVVYRRKYKSDSRFIVWGNGSEKMVEGIYSFKRNKLTSFNLFSKNII